jgi:hypothetical protein
MDFGSLNDEMAVEVHDFAIYAFSRRWKYSMQLQFESLGHRGMTIKPHVLDLRDD